MLGLCCQYLEPKTKRNKTIDYINIIDENNLQYNQYLKGKYSDFKIISTWIHNVQQLLYILQRINNEGIKLFRISSSLLPLYDSLPDLLHNCQEVKDILSEVGKFVLNNQMRLTMHPDQFVVISSNRLDVIQNSIRMLEHHSWIFDQMNLPATPYYAINIHGGAKNNLHILINSIKQLNHNTKNRLTLENDESSYNVKDLCQAFQETGIPICFDSHHHTFNTANLSIEEALNISKSTWNNIKPLTHLSNTDPDLINSSFQDRRKHSDFVHYIPECQKQDLNNNLIDIELEFKMKNIALFKAIKDFNLKLS